MIMSISRACSSSRHSVKPFTTNPYMLNYWRASYNLADHITIEVHDVMRGENDPVHKGKSKEFTCSAAAEQACRVSGCLVKLKMLLNKPVADLFKIPAPALVLYDQLKYL